MAACGWGRETCGENLRRFVQKTSDNRCLRKARSQTSGFWAEEGSGNLPDYGSGQMDDLEMVVWSFESHKQRGYYSHSRRLLLVFTFPTPLLVQKSLHDLSRL